MAGYTRWSFRKAVLKFPLVIENIFPFLTESVDSIDNFHSRTTSFDRLFEAVIKPFGSGGKSGPNLECKIY